jgi:hypothetical protein
MTSTASTARWLPAAIARAAVVRPAPSEQRPRHLAPDAEDTVLRLVTADVVTSTGRHAEPEWMREQFDPRRDEDPFEWLGFTAAHN